jgi:uncharacterized UPF0160 family protein
MIRLVNDIKEANCITHGGTMHADEVFATAFLELYLNDINVYRTMEINPNDFEKDIIIYDIGRGIFDHHQQDALKRENGITYSSFGLLWKTFGLDYLKRRNVFQPEEVFSAMEKDFVIAIDADDNGVFPKIETDGTYKIKTLPNIIKLFNPSYESDDDSNEQFIKAVSFAKIILEEEIKSIIGKTKAKFKVIEYYNKTENNILVLNEYMPYEEVLLTIDDQKKIDFVVFPSNRGGYNVKTVPNSFEDKTFRKSFPEEWGGLTNERLEEVTNVSGARFCHNTRFLLSCNTIEAAYQLIDKALSSDINKNIDL